MLGIACVICCLLFVGLNLLLWQKLIIALIVALTATLLESFAQFGVDNLLVPVGSAAIAFWLVQVFA